MSFPRRTIGILATILVAAVLAAGIYFRITGSEESDDGAAGDESELPDVSAASSFSTSVAIPVEGRAAVRDTLVLSVSAAGQAEGAGRAVVTAQVDGRVREVRVRESDYVTADQLLVAIESEEFELELERAEAELESARAQYRDLVLFNDRIED
ncbi:MAG: biotin/lipoyl-binding protein, partial [Gemmatimonadota bacterium]